MKGFLFLGRGYLLGLRSSILRPGTSIQDPRFYPLHWVLVGGLRGNRGKHLDADELKTVMDALFL